MQVFSLLMHEISHRKLVFLAGVIAVALSVGISVSSVMLMETFDRDTEIILQLKEEQAKGAWAEFKDGVRKTMLELGFNLLILHEAQNLSTPDEHTKYLPESYATKLAEANLMSINHVLPFLKQKVWWPEQSRWITLYGTLGEVQIKNPAKQVPMVNMIQSGHASLGRGVYESTGLHKGDQFILMGKTFVVHDCRPAEGFEEDEQIRISLNDAQDLLDKNELITGMMAINCVCADPLGMANIRKQVTSLLPNTQVREHKGNMVVRVEERARVAREADASLGREQKARASLRVKRDEFNAILIPLVTVVAVIWLGLIIWLNVRHRRSEIAILRAIGWTNHRVFRLIIGKAVIIGLTGGIVGCVAGITITIMSEKSVVLSSYDLRFLAGSVVMAMLLAAIASWIPATLAAQTDPAVVLQEE